MREEFVCPKDKSIVIFGGHENWLKGMKRALKGVTIINADCPNSTKRLKYADEIWIQHNAISHSLADKIRAFSRESKVPLYYFAWSSHKKCVEQFVRQYGISS